MNWDKNNVYQDKVLIEIVKTNLKVLNLWNKQKDFAIFLGFYAMQTHPVK